MRDILQNVQIHMPFHLLRDKHMSMVLRERINPEISFNHVSLDQYGKDDFRVVAETLLEAHLRVTFHAPFLDLRPGAFDPKIRQVTIDRLNEVFDLIPYFRPLSIVCHPSFDKRYYVSGEKLWLQNSIDTWSLLSSRLEGTDTIITLENVYESDPEYLFLLLSSLKSPRIRFCFDTGHFNVFSRTSLGTWMEKMASFLGQIHLHDNDGSADDHLPAGQGSFPFPGFFEAIRERGIAPLITLEAHSERDIWRAAENVKAMNLLAGLSPNQDAKI